MANPTIVTSLPEQVTQEQPNILENSCSPFDATAEVARARALLVQVRASQRVEHIIELARLQDRVIRRAQAQERRERDAEIRRIDREVAR